MTPKYERRNFSFPPGFLQELDAVLTEEDNLSQIVRDYLKKFVAARKGSLARK